MVYAYTINQIVNTVLTLLFAIFNIFAWVTAQQTYDNLFIPEMKPYNLFPSLLNGNQKNLFSASASLSNYILINIIDPILIILLLIIGFIYLGKVFLPSWNEKFRELIPRFVIATVVANFTVYISGIILEFGLATYIVLYGYGDKNWQHFGKLYPLFVTPWGNNSLLEFILKVVVIFTIVTLSMVIAIRTSLIAVLIVLLPIGSIMWIFPQTRQYAKKIWVIFIEMVFLPFFVLIPLILATSINDTDTYGFLLTTGMLLIAAGMPYFISNYGGSIAHMGMDKVSSFINYGLSTGMSLSSMPITTGGYFISGATSGLSGSKLLASSSSAGNMGSGKGIMHYPANKIHSFSEKAGHSVGSTINKAGNIISGEITGLKYSKKLMEAERSRSNISNNLRNVGSHMINNLHKKDTTSIKKNLNELNRANDRSEVLKRLK